MKTEKQIRQRLEDLRSAIRLMDKGELYGSHVKMVRIKREIDIICDILNEEPDSLVETENISFNNYY